MRSRAALPIAIVAVGCSQTHTSSVKDVDGAGGAGGEPASTASSSSGGTAPAGVTLTDGGGSGTGGSGEAGAQGDGGSVGDPSTAGWSAGGANTTEGGTTSGTGGASTTGRGENGTMTSGNAAVGGTGAGGSGGGAPEPSTVGTVGERCAPNGALGCAAHAQQQRLECVSGQWELNGSCSGSNNCDTTPGSAAGTCQPIVTECVGKTPGDRLCRNKELFDCGPDLVTRESVDECEGGCVDGACTECQPGATQVCGACEFGTETCLSSGSWGSCEDSRRSCATGQVCGSDESCCTSAPVPGGSYRRGGDDTQPNDATVSDFCLDKYEVTVGRFREFVEDYDDFVPFPGDGEHQPGAGSGWLSEWGKGQELAVDESALRTALTDCGGNSYSTWRDAAGTANAERLPINCINWFTAFAFCIWDGGRLATEAEWEYAAGGANDWQYPWGNTAPDDGVHAVYDYCGGTGSCSTQAYGDIIAVGSRPGGAGYWAHLDMAGSMFEWVFDWFSLDFASTSTCSDCANLEPDTLPYDMRVLRGGSWTTSSVSSITRTVSTPELSGYESGIRCVRSE